MDIFWRLLLSHLLSDFTLQTNWINKMKREKITGVIIHVLIHLIVTYTLLFPYLSSVWFNLKGIFQFKGYLMLLLICMFHFAVDQLRIYIIKNNIYPDNTISFLVDQLFHLYFIFIFTPFNNVPINFAGEKVVMIFSFLVLVSHTTTILIYYIEKDLNDTLFPSFDQKYFMIFERIILFGFMLIENKIGWVLIILWILQLYYMKIKKIIDISNINFYFSVIISFIFGIIARYYL
ncbi:MAG: DUF3307 domain-containing protein [Elusimicrobiales bacterium]|nr:DUF3307 domain-containing protein [Elusimicrobiales bacterium]